MNDLAVNDTVAKDVWVLADDLSGAAECAAAFLGTGRPVAVHLTADHLTDGASRAAGEVTVVDLNTRTMDEPDCAAGTLRNALDAVPSDAVLVKKIDSLLRGHIRAEVGALADRGPVLVAAGLPVLGRLVVDGVLHVDGTPLHHTDHWSAETQVPPESVAALLRDLPTEDRISIHDVLADGDLDAIVRSVAGTRTQLVGTAALAAAVARVAVPHSDSSVSGPIDRGPVTPRMTDRVLVVAGTAAPAAREQITGLVDAGACHIRLPAADLLAGTIEASALHASLREHRVTVVSVSGELDAARARVLSTRLGAVIADAQAATTPDLVLTGGETARGVLDALGISLLHPYHEIHHGTVLSCTPEGRRLVTRPGSFGDADSFTTIVDHLLAPATDHATYTETSRTKTPHTEALHAMAPHTKESS